MPRFEALALKPGIEPMEAQHGDRIPTGDDWSYEPKWDGFRCIAFRAGADVELQSKSGKPLTRYFPEVVAALLAAPEPCFVVDGELYVERDDAFDFDALLQRIHPAESRVRMLAKQTPASYALFDLLVEKADRLYEKPLTVRRKRLRSFAARNVKPPAVVLSPSTDDARQAAAWLAGSNARTDGVIAKRNVPYAFGSRDAVVKIKRHYTADCVVGGFRAAKGGAIASLLLGLYNDAGKLDHVGFIGSMSGAERVRARTLLEPLVGEPGFTGASPGGPSRWRRSEETAWIPVKPKLVVEVAFDHVTGHRFRHAARLLRWRPDKAPRRCTMDQLTGAIATPMPLERRS